MDYDEAIRSLTAAESALARVAAMPQQNVYQAANSYFGLLRQASHSHTDRAHLANVVRDRGMAVDRALSKAFPGKSGDASAEGRRHR